MVMILFASCSRAVAEVVGCEAEPRTGLNRGRSWELSICRCDSGPTDASSAKPRRRLRKHPHRVGVRVCPSQSARAPTGPVRSRRDRGGRRPWRPQGRCRHVGAGAGLRGCPSRYSCAPASPPVPATRRMSGWADSWRVRSRQPGSATRNGRIGSRSTLCPTFLSVWDPIMPGGKGTAGIPEERHPAVAIGSGHDFRRGCSMASDANWLRQRERAQAHAD